MFRFCRVAALLSCLACLCGQVAAQQACPSKPLTVIVNGGAGSLPDLFARPLADRLRHSLGQAVVVDNRPGVGGMVAMQALKSAPADGHQLALITNAHAVWNPYVFPTLSYDPVADLLPVSPVAVIPMALAVNAGVPDEVVARLNRKVGAALQDPALQASIASHGSIVWHDSPTAFAERIAADRRLWTPVLQQLNLTPN